MKKLLASTILAAAGAFMMTGGAQAAAHAACGTVTVANMNWQSAEVLAQIDKIILSEGYGCDVQMVPGDTMPTLTSMMEKGEPDVAPEAWVNAVREPLDKAVADGKLVYAGASLSDGGEEGWWIPKYLADANPDIKTIDDALMHPELFPAPEDPSKGAVYNCPSGWNCQITTGNFFKAHEAESKGFVLVDSGSAAGLDGSIAKAYERQQGWLGYYWAPTSILGKYEMVKLGFNAEYDKAEWDSCTAVLDCAAPKKNAWPSSEVFTVTTASFAEKAGPAMDYIKARNWPNSTVNKLLAWMSENQATGEEGAKYFLENNKDVWTKWVSPEVAEKVSKSMM
jgi:glycine betaine/proline transport system substrate-binding protein